MQNKTGKVQYVTLRCIKCYRKFKTSIAGYCDLLDNPDKRPYCISCDPDADKRVPWKLTDKGRESLKRDALG